jgi:hypothetical protein
MGIANSDLVKGDGSEIYPIRNRKQTQVIF